MKDRLVQEMRYSKARVRPAPQGVCSQAYAGTAHHLQIASRFGPTGNSPPPTIRFWPTLHKWHILRTVTSRIAAALHCRIASPFLKHRTVGHFLGNDKSPSSSRKQPADVHIPRYRSGATSPSSTTDAWHQLSTTCHRLQFARAYVWFFIRRIVL
ncbi:hypothetical protein K461DRAFT_44470 [Myriangium duriaei CBS 260.36]|uniref:Uncharacterized protein n=1 Tax=Myriangium duriaei CBS 260.36 TaxID=1168546 RepID=A0A9P4IV27_9PEZI|nr:hypothetical protein K461DRAFT_44470 [Myriangium duriaei CBS 260.36]